MKELQIDYLTEDPAPKYAAAIRKVKTVQELVKAIEPYKVVAGDALKVAQQMTAKDFKDFKRDIVKAAKAQPVKWIDEFNRRFGAVAMPLKMVIVTLLASEYKAPWGTAYIRCNEENWPMINKSKLQ